MPGFPRNEENRAAFEEQTGLQPTLVLFFDCPEEARAAAGAALLPRRAAGCWPPACRASPDLPRLTAPPLPTLLQVMERRLLGRNEGRTDDNIETIRKRFRVCAGARRRRRSLRRWAEAPGLRRMRCGPATSLPPSLPQVFLEQSLPVISHYEALGRVARINADREPDAIYQARSSAGAQFLPPAATASLCLPHYAHPLHPVPPSRRCAACSWSSERPFLSSTGSAPSLPALAPCPLAI